MKRWMSVLLTVVMVVALVMSMSPAAFADDSTTPAPVVTPTKTPTITIPVEMKLTGTKPNPAETYNIVLAMDGVCPMPTGTTGSTYTIQITGEGKAAFSITYDTVGIYSYKIYQLVGENPNPKCHYDKTVYDVVVYVTNNADYTGLETTVCIYPLKEVKGDVEFKPNEGGAVVNPSGTEYTRGAKVDKADFINKYWVAPANTPSTGDESNVVLYALVFVLALATLTTGIVVLKRKKQ